MVYINYFWKHSFSRTYKFICCTGNYIVEHTKSWSHTKRQQSTVYRSNSLTLHSGAISPATHFGTCWMHLSNHVYMRNPNTHIGYCCCCVHTAHIVLKRHPRTSSWRCQKQRQVKNSISSSSIALCYTCGIEVLLLYQCPLLCLINPRVFVYRLFYNSSTVES